ncbi:MAG: SPFH domain-containing protein, partial [Phycisphaeraceae bacterium]
MSQTPPNPVPPDSDPTGPSQRPGPGAGPSPGAGPGEGPGLDAAQQSLSDALRVSFTVLKALMIGLLVIYLFSGVFRVKEETTTVRYLFGEEIGTYSDARWYFGLPYPFEEKIVVPGKIQTLRLDDSFWYHNPDDKKPEDLAFEQLDPLKDSFLITGDTNVIHVQFGVNYSIDKDAVDDYLRNVGSLERANELVRTAAERGMIHYVATTNVEDTITKSKFDTPAIASYTQRVLDELQTGIQIQQVLIDNNNQSMPNQVREAYTGVTRAQADKAKTIQEARREYNQTLGKAAGGAHTELLSMI